MSSPQLISFILALVDLALGGFISNGFILTVILRVWNKSRSLDSSEQLLLSLVLTNLWATVLVILTCINDYIIPMFPKSLMYSLNDFIIICRHWFTACLCVFYYIKIVNSTHSLFLWCKLRISWLVPRLIAGSLVVSLFLVLFMSFFTLINIQRNTTLIGTQMNEEISQHHNTGIHEILFLIVGSGSPLLVILVCCILVVASLCKHVYRMKSKEHNSRSIQTKAHIKATGVVLCILLLYLLFYVAQTFSLIVIKGKIEIILVTTTVYVYSCAQAYVLLLVNPNLNQAAIQVLPRRET
ncbi:taste receptor type 2 member 8-like [Anolis carolinensis]|uniref:taste receptor type 2 member 8-like n=1 Tax=Anolis carolinensis TaxID=28377 RepID=UPI002F2B5776